MDAPRRPRGGPHLENNRYWTLSESELRFVIQDAGEALQLNPTAEPADKWADQINDACTVLKIREEENHGG